MSDDRLDETLDQLHRNAVRRAEEGDWSQLELLLGEGRTRPSGIHLTQAECKILHEILRGERKRARGGC